MKKILASLFAVLALSALAQTVPPPTNAPPTIGGALSDLWNAVQLDHTNWLWEAHGLYAPALKLKYGGGFGAFYELNQWVFTGLRVDYVDGGFWMPSGSAGLQLPISPFSWLHVTPFTYAGIGVPINGAKVGDFTVPGSVRDNNGQATAILGYGAAIRLFTTKTGRWNVDIVGDAENWTGFSGRQYRGGILLHKTF